MLCGFHEGDMPALGGQWLDLSRVQAPVVLSPSEEQRARAAGWTPPPAPVAPRQPLHQVCAPPLAMPPSCTPPLRVEKRQPSLEEDVAGLAGAIAGLVVPAPLSPAKDNRSATPETTAPPTPSETTAEDLDAVSVASAPETSTPEIKLDLEDGGLFPGLPSAAPPRGRVQMPKVVGQKRTSVFQSKEQPAPPPKEPVVHKTVCMEAECWEAEACRRAKGPGGKHLKAIEAKTGCTISMHGVDASLKGTQQAVTQAAALIEKHFAKVVAEYNAYFTRLSKPEPTKAKPTSIKVYVDETWAGFEREALRRIKGTKACHLKKLEVGGGRVSMRGKGTDHGSDPLHAVVSSEALADKVKRHFEEVVPQWVEEA